MSTRVTSAIASRKARENLVRLLFPSDGVAASGSASVGASSSASPLPEDTQAMRYTDRHSHSYRRRHRPRLSSANDTAKDQHQRRHSYAHLRATYLRRVHDMHPDKMAHRNQQQSTEDEVAHDNNNTAKDAHFQFIELKNAWEEYHASLCLVRDTGSTNTNPQHSGQDDDYMWEEDEESFTMFGVGCSFADSPDERALRNKIMDEACRGWFSSGSLSHEEGQRSGGIGEDTTQQLRTADERPQTKLSDDDMFVREDPMAGKHPRERKFLVQTADRSRRKRS